MREIAKEEEHGSRLNQTLIELTSELHGTQRDVKDFEVQVANCAAEGKKVEDELIVAEFETQVSGKQLDIVRNEVSDCVRALMMAESELETTRGDYWHKVNKYIDGVNEYASKVRQVRSENSVNNANTGSRRRRSGGKDFKIKGEREAFEMYEKYQVKKIKTLSEHLRGNCI